jgi:orotidine-5'-phosphate decarboxylase
VAQAREVGLDGLVLSAEEVGAVRASLGRKMILLALGIRPVGAEASTFDQKRTKAPATAIAAGADYLVVGRPVTQTRHPREAAAAIIVKSPGPETHVPPARRDPGSHRTSGPESKQT